MNVYVCSIYNFTQWLVSVRYFLGRYTAQDIAVFARDTSTSNVFTLGPENFPSPVTTGEENWFVDFFAPVRCVKPGLYAGF